jgi:hypothetical protein
MTVSLKSNTINLSELASLLSGKSRPPVQNWHPEREGEIDICIKNDGRWIHEGGEITRKELVTLFASILRLDEEGYFLVTPVEKLRIEVEDAPFTVVSMQRLVDESGRPLIIMKTNCDEKVLLDQDHALWVDVNVISGEPRPYIEVRDGLKALVQRSVYYELVNAGEIKGNEMVIKSAGSVFSLGCVGEN